LPATLAATTQGNWVDPAIVPPSEGLSPWAVCRISEWVFYAPNGGWSQIHLWPHDDRANYWPAQPHFSRKRSDSEKPESWLNLPPRPRQNGGRFSRLPGTTPDADVAPRYLRRPPVET